MCSASCGVLTSAAATPFTTHVHTFTLHPFTPHPLPFHPSILSPFHPSTLSPFHRVSLSGVLLTILLLADVIVVCQDGNTALTFACQSGLSDVAATLIFGAADSRNENEYDDNEVKLADAGRCRRMVATLQTHSSNADVARLVSTVILLYIIEQ
jgi:hypothetical protein